MAQTRYYSSTSGSMTLVGAINASATSLIVDTTTGLPASTPFTIIVDPGLASMEIMDCTAVAGTTLTVTRGRDGTSGQSHDNGAVIRHGFSARDFDESRAHEDDTTAHGATGAVVGTTNTQVLTNKDLSSGTNAFPTSLATLTGTQTLTNKTIDGANNTLSNIPSSAVTGLDAHTAATAAHGTTGAVVGISDTQTLTNKTISGASNTLTNIAQSSVTSLTTDLAGHDTRLDALEADTGDISTGVITAASGWTLAEEHGRRIGNVAMITFTFTRTGSAISSSTTGNITNVSVGTVAAGWRPALDEAGVSPRSTGTSWNGYVAGGSGTIGLGNLPPNVALGVGDQISGTATYLCVE